MKMRANIGDFISIVCFKSVISGMEDILGVEGTASAMIAAGRKRGAGVAEAVGLKGKNPPLESLASTLDKALGAEGTCLCQIVEVSSTPEGGFLVKAKDTVCTSAEPPGSTRVCTYTLGAVMGFLECVYGKTLFGKHTGNVLKGSATDDFVFTPVG